MLAAVAGTTKNIRLGTGVTRLPMNHPLKTAEDFSLLDVISNGRLNFGIGKAYDLLEFQSYGINPDERDDRYQETFEIVMQGWKTGRINYKGKYLQVPGPGEQADEIQLMPMPIQKPHPPVFVMVSQTEASLRAAARQGFAFVLGQMPTWDHMARLVNIYREEARDAGYSYDAIDENVARSSQLKAIHVSDDRETAKKEHPHQPREGRSGARRTELPGLPRQGRDHPRLVRRRRPAARGLQEGDRDRRSRRLVRRRQPAPGAGPPFDDQVRGGSPSAAVVVEVMGPEGVEERTA
jgi:alkanesulfonate monooxygenase SsuD/methylene tetrahydromethanopterin reductase-like flavin-dependent oxidoreductase (luciferase family)